MDLSKLSRGDQVIGISGIVLFIVSFFKWFGVTPKGSDIQVASAGGWNGLLTIVAVLIGIAMATYVVLKAAGVELPNANWPLILLIAGGVAVVFVLIKLLVGVSLENVSDDAIDVKRKIPLFIGLVASAGMAAGAFLNFQEARGGGGAPSSGGSSGGPTV